MSPRVLLVGVPVKVPQVENGRVTGLKRGESLKKTLVRSRVPAVSRRSGVCRKSGVGSMLGLIGCLLYTCMRYIQCAVTMRYRCIACRLAGLRSGDTLRALCLQRQLGQFFVQRTRHLVEVVVEKTDWAAAREGVSVVVDTQPDESSWRSRHQSSNFDMAESVAGRST